MNEIANLNISTTVRAKIAVERVLDESGPIFMACRAITPCHSITEMRETASRAEAFLAAFDPVFGRIAADAEHLSDQEVGPLAMMFVSAWPNASNGDLGGYGAQLLDDLLSEEPCRYALAETFRKLRRTSRFLPSIAEVLTELEVNQKRIRNSLFHIRGLPALIEQLRSEADRRDRIDAAQRDRSETKALS